MIIKELILVIRVQYYLMQFVNKTRIAIVIGITIIVFVASLVGLPFMNSDSGMEKVSHESIKKVDESEQKVLDLIAREKAELESKVGGKINLP
jgi:hypothetical protein